MNTLVRRSLGCLAALSLALAIAPAALAGSPVDPTTLNPVPPDVYTCQADGPNTICRASFVDTLEGADDGPLCGDLHFFEWVTVNLDASGPTTPTTPRSQDRAGKPARRVQPVTDRGRPDHRRRSRISTGSRYSRCRVTWTPGLKRSTA